MKRLLTWRKHGALVLSLISTVLVWEFGVRWFDVPKFLLPLPSSLLVRLAEDGALLLKHISITARESLAGFALAVVCAFVFAVLLAEFRIARRVLFPYLVGIRVTPTVAIAPLLVIWLGFGMTPKIVVAALICFFPVVVNTVIGLRSPNPDMIALMRTYSASEWDILRKIRLPTALPFLLSSLRIAAPTSVIGAIVGEMVGSDTGLGYLLLLSKGYLDTELLFICIFLSAGLGLLFFVLVSAVEGRLLRWHESQLEA